VDLACSRAGKSQGQAYAPSATPSALKEQGTGCEHGTRPLIAGVSRTVAEWRLLELQTRGPALLVQGTVFIGLARPGRGGC